MKVKDFGDICLILSPLMYHSLICAMHATLSSNNIVGSPLIEENPHDS